MPPAAGDTRRATIPISRLLVGSSWRVQSALMAGLEVPSSTLQNVSKFLDAMQDPSGSHYHYHAGNYMNHAMTAEGLLCRQYLGWKQDDERLVNGDQFLSAALSTAQATTPTFTIGTTPRK